MKRILLQFALLYGQVSAAVVTISFVLYFIEEPPLSEFCERLSLGVAACRGVAAVLLLVAFSLATVLGLWTMRRRERNAGDGNNES